MNKHEDGGHERRKEAAKHHMSWMHTKLLLGIIGALLAAISVLWVGMHFGGISS